MAQFNEYNVLESLNYFKFNKSNVGEILGINKISKKTSMRIFKFMDKYLIKKNKKLSWEFMLNTFLKNHKDKFFILKNQNYIWKNINYRKDYNYIKRII